MRQGRKTEDTGAPAPPAHPPWAVREDWSIDEVVTLATSAVGDGIEWLRHRPPNMKLRKGESRTDTGGSETYILVGQLLNVYATTAARLSKDAREALSDKNLKNVTQKQLMELMVAEVKRDPALRAAMVRAIEESRAALS